MEPSHPHYADHLRPILALLPDLPDDVAVVAGYPDVRRAKRAGYRRIVLTQHGAGQSYSTDHAHYPGGIDNDAVGLFLVPNEHAGQRWKAAYPDAAVEVVGCPRLDELPAPEPGPVTIAFSWHWDAYHTPEGRSAFDWYRGVLREVATTFTVIGHGHPRRRDLARAYRVLGIEHVPDFDEVCRRASVYVCDNSSSMFEFASTGRPVVTLNAPWYRRETRHGLRFWDAADVGIQVDEPAELIPAIARALELRVDDVGRREMALDEVYAYRTGAAQRAADAIRAWVA